MSRVEPLILASYPCFVLCAFALACLAVPLSRPQAAQAVGQINFPAAAEEAGAMTAGNGKVFISIRTVDKGLFCYDASTMSDTPIWSVSLGVKEDGIRSVDVKAQVLAEELVCDIAGTAVFASASDPPGLFRASSADGTLLSMQLDREALRMFCVSTPSGPLLIVVDGAGFAAFDPASLALRYRHDCPSGMVVNAVVDSANSSLYYLTAEPDRICGFDVSIYGTSNPRQSDVSAGSCFCSVSSYGLAVCSTISGEVRLYDKNYLWPALSALTGLNNISDVAFVGNKLVEVSYYQATSGGALNGAFCVLDFQQWSATTHSYSPSYPLTLIPTNLNGQAFALDAGTPVSGTGSLAPGSLWVIDVNAASLTYSELLQGCNTIGCWDNASGRVFVVEPELEVIKAFAIP